jgi:zinc finger SWIM domain-containing protein 3
MMGAKRGFPPTRKITMYDYSNSIQRYNDLHNISQTAAFVVAQSQEAFERLKHVLEEEVATIPVNRGEGGRKTFGPVLPQALDVDSTECYNVLDPIRVLSRGAPKKKLKSSSDRSDKYCTLCKDRGHHRRTYYLKMR